MVLGCGEMAREAINDLYKSGKFEEITVGTRDLSKANAVLTELGLGGRKTKITTFHVDIGRATNLEESMRGFDVVVNCSGPNYKNEMPVAQAALRSGLHLVDINDDYETTFLMLDLNEQVKKAGLTFILGLGASPGITNVLVRAAANQMDEVEEIHTAWVMSGADPGGLALSYHLLHSLSGRALTFQGGRLVEVQSFVDGKERMEFPAPVGTLDVYHIGHPEPITLSRCFPGARLIDDKASFHPPFVNDWIVSLGQMARGAGQTVMVKGREIDPMDFAAALFHQKCKSLSGIPKEGALRVEVKGKKLGKAKRIVYSSAGLISQGTGIPASIGAQMLAAGRIKKTGVLAPEECIEPDEFVRQVLNRNIAKLNGWVENQR